MGVLGLQVPLILLIHRRDLQVPVLYSHWKKSAATHAGDSPRIIAVLRQLVEFD